MTDMQTVNLPATESAHHARLLVVDDDESLLQFLKEGLELHGYEVTTSSSGADAFRRIMGRSWDLVITDYKMPGADGRTLFDLTRSINPDLANRMIFITGISFDRNLIEFLSSTNCIFLRKPLQIQLLLEAIEKNLELPGRS